MSETNNNTPMRITQLEEATAYENGMYYPVAKAGSGTKKIDVNATPPSVKNINGSYIKTNEIDYSLLTITSGKKISGYDTTTYDPIIVDGGGSVVAQFDVADLIKYGDIKIPRPTISTQWIIASKTNSANNYTKSATNQSVLVDLSNSNYGIIHTNKLYDQNFIKVAIAFDSIVNITYGGGFDSFFKLLDTVLKNENASLSVRNLYYSDTVNIDRSQSNTTIPFYIYNGEKIAFKNNTSGSIALTAIDENNDYTTITSGVASGQTVEFTANKDFIKLFYWSQQTGTLTVNRTNAVLYEWEHDDENSVVASVNMFRSIAAIGDSYTAGSTKNSGGSWVDYRDLSWIATMGKRSGTSWKNYGHGGSTTKTYQETTEFSNALSDTACDLYFFALGQNDGNQGMTIGTVADIHDSDYTQNPDTFYGNYGRIIQQIKDHAPKARLVMIKNWVSGSTYTDYDAAIEGIAAHYNIPCISPFDDFFFNSALYTSYMEYGHPTTLGYSSMGLAMERLFSKCVMNNGAYFKFSTIG